MKRRVRKGILPFMCGLALLVSSCAEGSPFPNIQIQQADPSVRISALIDSPEDFLGKTVILGGVINMVERTGIINRVYVQTYPLGKNYLPDLGRPPKGHFMIITDHPLQVSLYAPGRTVEVIGMVQLPQKMVNLAGRQEKIPVIRARYLHAQSPDPPRAAGMGMGFGFMPGMGF
ncbi:MAG: Slp family lipoprotein [Leptospirales bacterium]